MKYPTTTTIVVSYPLEKLTFYWINRQAKKKKKKNPKFGI